jgi:hypothetical protein
MTNNTWKNDKNWKIEKVKKKEGRENIHTKIKNETAEKKKEIEKKWKCTNNKKIGKKRAKIITRSGDRKLDRKKDKEK